MTIKLEVTKREQSAAATRAAGLVPAVVYGPKQEPISIAVDKKVFDKTVHEAGESTILELVGLDDSVEVLIQDVTFSPEREGIIHADLYAIERGKELTTNVALSFIGEAPVEKSGATVTKTLYEVEVTCRPSALPSHIDVDLAVLTDTDAQIHVQDLVVADGVTINTDPETVVATVSEARTESESESESVTEESVLAEPESDTEAATE